MCYTKGGSCECTSHPEYAITDSDGNPIKVDVRERLKQKMEKNKLIRGENMRSLNEAIKGLRCCINEKHNGCNGCPYSGKDTEEIDCRTFMQSDVLAFFECNFENKMDKLRIENSKLIQRIQQLEKDLAKEMAYNHAIVTVIRNNYPT